MTPFRLPNGQTVAQAMAASDIDELALALSLARSPQSTRKWRLGARPHHLLIPSIQKALSLP